MIFRIERRVDEDGRALARPQDLDVELIADRRKLAFQIADREALLQRVCVVAGRCAPDDNTLAIKEWLIAERIGICNIVHLERDETIRHAARELPFKGLAADKAVLVHAHEAIETCLEGRV